MKGNISVKEASKLLDKSDLFATTRQIHSIRHLELHTHLFQNITVMK